MNINIYSILKYLFNTVSNRIVFDFQEKIAQDMLIVYICMYR